MNCTAHPPASVFEHATLGKWRCTACERIHFFCGRCKARKTIPEEWERPRVDQLGQSIPSSPEILDLRSNMLNIKTWLCDPCWQMIKTSLQDSPCSLEDIRSRFQIMVG